MNNGVPANKNLDDPQIGIPSIYGNSKISPRAKYHQDEMIFPPVPEKVCMTKNKNLSATKTNTSYDLESTHGFYVPDRKWIKHLIAVIVYFMFVIAVTLFILYCGQNYEPQSMNAYTLQ